MIPCVAGKYGQTQDFHGNAVTISSLSLFFEAAAEWTSRFLLRCSLFGGIGDKAQKTDRDAHAVTLIDLVRMYIRASQRSACPQFYKYCCRYVKYHCCTFHRCDLSSCSAPRMKPPQFSLAPQHGVLHCTRQLHLQHKGNSGNFLDPAQLANGRTQYPLSEIHHPRGFCDSGAGQFLPRFAFSNCAYVWSSA